MVLRNPFPKAPRNEFWLKPGKKQNFCVYVWESNQAPGLLRRCEMEWRLVWRPKLVLLGLAGGSFFHYLLGYFFLRTETNLLSGGVLGSRVLQVCLFSVREDRVFLMCLSNLPGPAFGSRFEKPTLEENNKTDKCLCPEGTMLVPNRTIIFKNNKT